MPQHTYRIRRAFREERLPGPTRPEPVDIFAEEKSPDRITALEARIDTLERRLEGIIENYSLWDGS